MRVESGGGGRTDAGELDGRATATGADAALVTDGAVGSCCGWGWGGTEGSAVAAAAATDADDAGLDDEAAETGVTMLIASSESESCGVAGTPLAWEVAPALTMDAQPPFAGVALAKAGVERDCRLRCWCGAETFPLPAFIAIRCARGWWLRLG